MAYRLGLSDRVRHGGDFCSAFWCKSARYKQSCFGKVFHKFPKEEKRCRLWMQFTRREDFKKLQPADVQSLKLCSDHFEAYQYNNPAERGSLLWNAVPKLIALPQDPPPKPKTPATCESPRFDLKDDVKMETNNHFTDELGSCVPVKKEKTTMQFETETHTAAAENCVTVKFEPETDTAENWPVDGWERSEVKAETAEKWPVDGCERSEVKAETAENWPVDGCERSEVKAETAENWPVDGCERSQADDPAMETVVKFEIDVAEGPSLSWDVTAEQYIHGSGRDSVTSGTANIHMKPASSSSAGLSADSCVGLEQEDPLTKNLDSEPNSGKDCRIGHRAEHKKQTTVDCSIPIATEQRKQTKSKHVCQQCGAAFGRPSHLKAHMLIHSGDKPHVCQQCGGVFGHSRNLKKHMLIHTEHKPHKCSHCSASFRQSRSLKTHMKSHQCSQCKATFRGSGALTKHMQVHSGVKAHTCSQCSASFNTSGSLTKHRLVHTAGEFHTCSQCSASFRRLGDLKKHTRIHTGEKSHKCSECGAAFRDSSYLKAHMRFHTWKKPFKCSLCSASFQTPGSLTKHMLVHPGEFHKCSNCSAAFRQPDALKKHMLIHTDTVAWCSF